MGTAQISVSGGASLLPRDLISSKLGFIFGPSHDACCWARDIQGSLLGPGHQKRKELEASQGFSGPSPGVGFRKQTPPPIMGVYTGRGHN